MNGMNEQQQMQMQSEMMRDFLKSYNKTTKICFDDCVRNFTSGELSADEKSCGQRCVTKYLEYSARVAKEFMKRNNPGA
ncbi:Oidioi.mRNA.OKI2018_I69.chr1.g1522.t1.cds [Oikopleura dioica]|uniref:Mitochondrial import inner membrane translocase subunit n=1 Tax=Oikopleura dioica TaxID=34765 RepID=A0ABN7ST92_OIKDI|nr:Oidioi.mRNA.OKI2018_I69.chr1.g1522.t1.cds [Oikopleura dioica]